MDNLTALLRRLVPRSPLGMALGVAAVALAVSPALRRAVRKGVVQALAAGLALNDEIRQLSGGVRKELATLVAEAQATRATADGHADR